MTGDDEREVPGSRSVARTGCALRAPSRPCGRIPILSNPRAGVEVERPLAPRRPPLRPSGREVFIRMVSLPGDAAQVDTAYHVINDGITPGKLLCMVCARSATV